MGEVETFLAELQGPARQVIARGYDIARAAVPGCTEGRSYGMPALKFAGKPVVAFTVSANHCSVFPFSAAVVAAVAAELDEFSLSKGTIRFTPEKPLPDELIERVVRLRAAEIAGS